MPRAEAIAELRANAGSQFEPRIVESLVKVLDETEESAQSYSDAVRAVLAGSQAATLQLEPSAG
jgi:HD-GYP domain-containing protein (c-di-GMP phosphodiesterase class II)